MTTLVGAPARVDGVQLIGEMVGSGYRTPPSLVRRSDGQVLQLTPLLYLVLSAVDGRRSLADIAELVGPAMGRTVTEDNIRTLVDGQLRPLGLLRLADGSEPELKRSDPLLGLKLRWAATDPSTTRRLTDPFRVLFRPIVTAAVALGFVLVVAWVFFDRGLGGSAYDAFDRPHLLLLVFGVSILSGGFHEFGHAAAARYSGAQPGVMGAGVYLVWPAFYTDVTDSYRLGRAGRIRTDMGGLYFNAIVVCLTFVWWWATGWEALLLLVATQVLQMVQQLLPMLRFDGYHLLADIAGVPDLYHRIRPTLLGLLPHRWNDPENAVLKPWSRAVITLWVLVTIPLMALMLWALVMAVPRLVGTAGAAIERDTEAVAEAWADGGAIDVAAHVLQVLAVVLPILACAMILGRIGVRWFGGLAKWSRGSAPKRLVAAAVSAVLVTGLSWAWWPGPGTYRPIGPEERGLVTSLLPASNLVATDAVARSATGMLADPGSRPVGTAAKERLASDDPLVAVLEKGKEPPSKEDPVMAMVLVPTSEPGVGSDTSTSTPGASTSDQPSPTAAPTGTAPAPTEPPGGTWVFPFDEPLAPAEGDNQALAANTTDGSITYDLAFALVWAEDDQVLNVNEAHAYASCTDCVAVAVAFQVVLIMDDAQVVVPQNLATAANYECLRCITAAIANQLVLSVQEAPGEEELHDLADVWARLLEFGQNITSYTLTEVAEQLETFKSEIITILGESPIVELDDSTTTSPADGSTGPSPTTTSSGTATPSSPTTPSPSTTATPSPTTTSPSPSEGSTTTSSPSTTTSSPSPTTTASPTPTTTSSPSPTQLSSTTTPTASTSSGTESSTP